MSEWLDNQLNHSLRHEVDEHLDSCGQCHHYFAQLKNIQQQLATLDAPILSDNFDSRLADKINTLKQSDDNVVTLMPAALPVKARRFANLAMAASIAVGVMGLTWFMLPSNHITPQAQLLEESTRIIEIEALTTAVQHIDSMASLEDLNTHEQSNNSIIEISNFDQFTQIDDGYQDFNCGSTSGERGCTLAIDTALDDLMISI
jgi:hypothetical protein